MILILCLYLFWREQMKKLFSLLLCLALLIVNVNIAFASESQIVYNDKIAPVPNMQVVDDLTLLNEMAIDLGLSNTADQSFVVQYDSTRMIYQVTVIKQMNTAWYEPNLFSKVVADANDISGGWEWVSVISQNSYRGNSIFTGQWSQTSNSSSISSTRKNINCTLKGKWSQVVGEDAVVLQIYSATYSYTVSTSDI